MQTLLKTQIDEADAYFKDLIKSSNGEFEESHIDLKAGGITMRQFMDWHKEWNAQLKFTGDTVGFYRDIMVPAHPEHYALPPYPLVTPEFVQKYGIPWWEKVQMRRTLDDGSTSFYIEMWKMGLSSVCDFSFQQRPLNLFSMSMPSTWPLSFEVL
ncbi:Hypothetical protein PENO1_039210 [Penicillium occitanis (nom. inval.)]|nr:Hypothetical protein PENO1_039210 [Penicillium occitanis (nom. inval.)]PCH03122.1 hypothetical protein PENOC_040150 [Penicillium occitanis (nom. inval.)]